jgi:hypothetical protein
VGADDLTAESAENAEGANREAIGVGSGFSAVRTTLEGLAGKTPWRTLAASSRLSAVSREP